MGPKGRGWRRGLKRAVWRSPWWACGLILCCCGKALTFPGHPVSVGHLHFGCFHLGDLEIHNLAPGSLAPGLFASHLLLGPSVAPGLR